MKRVTVATARGISLGMVVVEEVWTGRQTRADAAVTLFFGGAARAVSSRKSACKLHHDSHSLII